ncbi:coiled-coil domain-containing protein 66 isoform X4 [Rhinatrema bivittatum]|uniref:coiled-coil domain-containing protein 66 isoform X4 n=1 Tax=Rhinatrema bivittatum TaxID=194408 RepID=UPI00112D60E0|nr:coiled-coil domain-containing protein 66 isoform X4 [Rhinatrema bivittatum]
MNLGDGLKLETQILDGKPKLILASCAVDSKVNKQQVCYKSRTQKHSLRNKQTGQILKSTQSTNVKIEKCLPKNRTGTGFLLTKGDRKPGNLPPGKPTSDSPKENKDHALIIQESEIGKQDTQKTNISIKKTVVSNTKQKSQKKHNITAEDLRNSLVCLTQDQLQQILLAARQGTKAVSEDQDDKEGQTIQASLDTNAMNNETDGNMGLHQTSGGDSLEVKKDSVLNEKEAAAMQEELKLDIRNNERWQQGDMFSTLGERERDKNLLEAKKSQWKKELDEQVALKKKQKENFQDQANYLSGRHSADNEKLEKQTTDQLKVEEHDRWAMHFDSFKKPDQPLPLNISPMQQSDTLYASPEPHETIDRSSTLSNLSYPGSEFLGKATEDISLRQNQKTSFLRSMTALLDPIQIEERERRRQKQLEHQKAIAAQVEEKRRQKLMEEERKQKEEQEEERRMIQEREQMQKQFEEEMLKQKQKEEVLTLKKKEIYQSMQRAQEQALRLKREQRMQALAKKGHDISKLQRNLDGNTSHWNYNRAPSSLSDLNPDDIHSETGDKAYQAMKALIWPRKETAVQTDDCGIGKNTSSEAYTMPGVQGENIDHDSPDISIEFKEQLNNASIKRKKKFSYGRCFNK